MSYTAPTPEEIARRRAQLAPFDGWNERAFCQIVAWMGVPQSYLDLGSGTGAMVNMARKIGIEAWGVDVINGPEHWFIQHDLTERLNLIRIDLNAHQLFNGYTLPDHVYREADADTERFDLITCLEVAEHLPLNAHETLVDTIARHLRPMPNYEDPSGLLIFSAAPPGQAGEHHIGCVVEGTRIQASAIQAATRRRYNGDVVTIVTSSGNQLTITPNHPIFTGEEWMAAGRICVGDTIACEICDEQGCSLTDGVVGGVVPHNYNRPTLIEQVFRSLIELPQARRRSVPGAAEDFHGDGTDSEIDIVRTNCNLVPDIQPVCSNPFGHLPFQGRDMCTPAFPRMRSLLKGFGGINTPPVNSRHPVAMPSSIIRSRVLPSQCHVFANATDWNPRLTQTTGNCTLCQPDITANSGSRFPALIAADNRVHVEGTTHDLRYCAHPDTTLNENSASGSGINMGLPRQGIQPFPRLVALDKVVKIHRAKYSGHVYNLSTKSGWYASNSIITHNCRPAREWRGLFHERGISYREDLTRQLAHLIAFVSGPASHWLASNLQVFDRGPA